MSTTQHQVSELDIVHCPKCNFNLFSPLFVYAYISSGIPVIDKPKVLSQCLTAFKCGECGLILPQSQFAEFTLEKIQAGANNNGSQANGNEEIESTESN